MSEHTVKETGHQSIVYVDGLSIAAYAAKLRLLKLIAEGGCQAGRVQNDKNAGHKKGDHGADTI